MGVNNHFLGRDGTFSPNGCIHTAFLLAASSLQTCLPLPDAFTAMPILSWSPGPSSRCSFSLRRGLWSSHKECHTRTSSHQQLGFVFFSNAARKELAGRSCCGWVVLWRWLTPAL